MSNNEQKSSESKEEEEGYPVVLYLYDLSRGMARAMSQSLLGKQLDGIWHTGVVVYDVEYFYGGGIQASRPGYTQAGTPMQRIDLGVTQIPQDVFHDFLRSVASEYTPETYNLLSHNCNNFSDRVASFLLDRKIPEFITGLPEEALNTPMGQMFRPMIENMQNQMRMNNVVPWGASALNLPPINPNARMVKASSLNIAPVPNTNSTAKNETKDTKNELKKSETSPETEHPHTKLSLGTVKNDMKPLLQKDKDYTKFVTLVHAYSKKIEAKAPGGGLTKEEGEALTAIGKSLSDPSVPIPQTVSNAIEKLIIKWPGKFLFPVFGVYQAILLREYNREALLQNYSKIIPKLISLLPSDENDKVKTKPATQMCALCAFINMFALPKLAGSLVSDQAFMEMLVAALQSEDHLVRLSASKVAQNAAMFLPKGSSSDGVIMLGSILPTCCMEESKANICFSLLSSLAQLVYMNEEACEVVGAMEFEAGPIVQKFQKSKMIVKLENVSKDIGAMLAAYEGE
mmetsp:Transcript_18288/g.32769  ORF Transcript_18288/g.32769 Transcript_18288/m.32769 type:complete len:514 (-) Transcript_18288:165-1706(-)